MKIVWTALALERIIDIADYIAEDNPRAAANLVTAIFNRVQALEDFPKSGRVVPEIGRYNIREIIHGNYRIIYRSDSNQIAILTVRHQKQVLPEKEIAKE